ncbi:hypothetical protein S40293_02221 [Stachybotrys chartarum IBT 40293]|nr:hypothetical protein S40293_02221 [Stachybotrys chartarum IBT 40293]
MPTSISAFFGCLNCFSRKTDEVIIATPISYDGDSEGPEKLSRATNSPERTLQRLEKDSASVKTHAIPQIHKFLTNPALLVVAKGKYEVRESFSFPSLSHDGEVVIRTETVGLNPIDWKSVDYGFCLPDFPWITGREMAGTVERVGSEVTSLKVGQRVWTSKNSSSEHEMFTTTTLLITRPAQIVVRCFQKYVTVPQHTVLPIPSNISLEQASCLGVAGLTAAMSLWHWLQVSGSPTVESKTISDSGYLLIWGGSAVTGQFAIQIATLGGLKVIAVISAKMEGLARQLGAAHTIIRDGKSGDEIVSEIRAIAGDGITRGIDLVGTETASFCLKALSTTQRALFAPLAMLSSKADVPANISVETVEMKQFVLNEASKVYADALNRLIEQGKVVLPEMTVLQGGFEAVLDGLERVKRGDMAGKKMVVRLSL